VRGFERGGDVRGGVEAAVRGDNIDVDDADVDVVDIEAGERRGEVRGVVVGVVVEAKESIIASNSL